MPPRWVDCPVCGERYMRSREDWRTCLRCEGPPEDARWQHPAYDRVRENADEDALLEAAGWLVENGEAEWAGDPEGLAEQLGLGE